MFKLTIIPSFLQVNIFKVRFIFNPYFFPTQHMDLTSDLKNVVQGVITSPTKNEADQWKAQVEPFAASASSDLSFLDRPRGIPLGRPSTETIADKFSQQYSFHAPRIYLPHLIQTAKSAPSAGIRREVWTYRYQQFRNHQLFDTPFPDPPFTDFEMQLLPPALQDAWAAFHSSKEVTPGVTDPGHQEPMEPGVASVEVMVKNFSLGTSRFGRKRRINARFSSEASRALASVLHGK